MENKNEWWTNHAALEREDQILEAGGKLRLESNPEIGVRCKVDQNLMHGVHRLIMPSLFVRNSERNRETVFPINSFSTLLLATFKIDFQWLLLRCNSALGVPELSSPEDMLAAAASSILLWQSRVVRFDIDTFGVRASIMLTPNCDLVSCEKKLFEHEEDLNLFFELREAPHRYRNPHSKFPFGIH